MSRFRAFGRSAYFFGLTYEISLNSPASSFLIEISLPESEPIRAGHDAGTGKVYIVVCASRYMPAGTETRVGMDSAYRGGEATRR